MILSSGDSFRCNSWCTETDHFWIGNTFSGKVVLYIILLFKSIWLFNANYCPFLTAIFFSALHHSLLNSMEHFLLKIGMVSFQSN